MQWLSSLGVFGSILQTIILVIEVLVVFNLMILVHEWGHFLAARWRGLKVEKFYIWFGKPIWKKTINGVEYGLGTIPAGGFVALPQMAPMDAIEGGSENAEPLPPITPLDKIIVAFAGPLFSFGLAVTFAFLVFWAGKPQGESHVTTTIGYVAEDSPAAAAGLQPGDTIQTIDGKEVLRFEGLVDSVRWAIVASEGENILFKVDRPGEGTLEIPVIAKLRESEEKPSWWSGIFKRPALREVGLIGKETPMVAKVQKNSPADEAGIRANDLVLKSDGKPVLSRVSFGDSIQKNPGKPVQLELDRDGEIVKVTLTPRLPDKRPEGFERHLLGIEWDVQGKREIYHPTPREQIRDALRLMGNTLSAIFSSKSDVGASHLSGPIGIFRIFYSLFQDSHGWQLVMWFSVVFNVNLAVLNMLPFPVLDGGHITMAIAEWIRRKPLHTRFLEIVQTGCALLLFGFMIFVSLKDAGDWVSGGGGDAKKDDIGWLPKEERGAAKAPAAPGS